MHIITFVIHDQLTFPLILCQILHNNLLRKEKKIIQAISVYEAMKIETE